MAQINTTVYVFGGGQGNVWTIDHNDLNSDHPANLIETNSDRAYQYIPNGLIYQQDGFLVVGAAHPQDPQLSIDYFNVTSHTWQSIYGANAGNNTGDATRPAARFYHATVLINDQILVYGGQNKTHAMGDLWSFSLATHQWTSLPLDPHYSRCGSSLTWINNSSCVVLGGYACAPQQPLPSPRPLSSLSSALLFDITNRTFIEKPLTGPLPTPRLFHTTVQSQDGSTPPYQIYTSSQGQLQDMVAMLNTQAWQWQSVPGTDNLAQPLPQAMAVGWMQDDLLVYGFGTTYQSVDDAIYILDTGNLQWQALDQPVSVDPPTNLSKTRFILHIAFAVVGGVCLLVLIGIMIRLGRRCLDVVKQWIGNAKKTIWKPRIGEPAWAESTRLTLMFITMTFFAFLIFFLVNQVINSPIIDQVSYSDNPTMSISAPDIRFCTNDTQTVIRCATDIGMQCSDYLIKIAAPVRPKQICYLFMAPPNFQLVPTNDRTAGNGSYIKFDYYFGQPAGIETALYHPLHNPNLVSYKLPDVYNRSFTWKDAMEQASFTVWDRKGVLTKNVHHLNSHVVTSGSYELIQHTTLRDTLWNYAGFSPQVDTNYEIDSQVLPETMSSQYSSEPAPLGSFHLYPMHYETKVLHEQRAFALVNATGVFGGLFGLFVSFQVVIFGYRPRSPWGIIHRWSVGQMRSSLLHELHKKFIPQSLNVPIVTPMRGESVMTMLKHQSIMRKTTTNTLSSTQSSSPATVRSPCAMPSPLLPSSTLPFAVSTPTQPPPAASLSSFFDMTMCDEPESYSASASDLDTERLTRMEDRMEMLEKLFQAYYIDDEIFFALESALRHESRPPAPPPQQQRQRSMLRFRSPFKR
ncbi:hypothetical protein DM01DRAFT_1386621 [Hesseltinella vesiculosa]|uniref:Galactose oxidase n=1 Tax=Hesseltinella vesiculosa TaxID=101127 RepID=A0A1X2G542_9FUNG|nr:hypothetical protein DM01DRAFT_1386621 [Hesseltinella vesiculosa]